MEDLYGRLQPVQPQDVAIHWYTDTLYTIHWYTDTLYTDTLIHDTLYTDIDDTLAQIGAKNRANHDNDDIVHIMNNFEWLKNRNAN